MTEWDVDLEFEIERQAQELAPWLRALVDASSAERGDRRALVGIAGGPGALKTTFSAALARALGGPPVVAMDGFHLSREQLRASADPARGLARRGAPFTFDARGFADAVAQMGARGMPAMALPTFDHAAGDPRPDALRIAAGEAPLVLVEGNYLLLESADGRMAAALGDPVDPAWGELRGRFVVALVLDDPRDVCLKRVALRHADALRLPPDEARARAEANDAPNLDLVRAGAGRADRRVTFGARISEKDRGGADR